MARQVASALEMKEDGRKEAEAHISRLSEELKELEEKQAQASQEQQSLLQAAWKL